MKWKSSDKKSTSGAFDKWNYNIITTSVKHVNGEKLSLSEDF